MQDIATVELTQLDSTTYFCRGCGKPLPEGSKARFHAECRRGDKRRRVADRREREAKRDARRLRNQLRQLNCPDCGASLAKLAQASLGHSVKLLCDAAQPPSEPLESAERLDDHGDGHGADFERSDASSRGESWP
jgi:RNase P subunit RPR2